MSNICTLFLRTLNAAALLQIETSPYGMATFSSFQLDPTVLLRWCYWLTLKVLNYHVIYVDLLLQFYGSPVVSYKPTTKFWWWFSVKDSCCIYCKFSYDLSSVTKCGDTIAQILAKVPSWSKGKFGTWDAAVKRLKYTIPATDKRC